MAKNSSSNEKKTKPAVVVIIIAVIAAAAVIGIYFGLGAGGRGNIPAREAEAASETAADPAGAGAAEPAEEKSADTDTSGYEIDDEAMAGVINYKGKEYKKRDDIRTILFMGIDQSEDRVEEEQTVANGGRADTIALFLLNDTDRTAQMVALSRDTMTDVDAYDENGEFMFSGPLQINMQYAYGDSPKRSCWLMKNKVSEVLFGAKIDGYLSMTMDGIKLIVDLLGGITASLPEDYTYIDPSYTKGAEVTFDGEAAGRFIRYRDLNELYSNDTRMERQVWFMQQMFKKLNESPNKADLLVSLIDKADNYIETDLEGETIRDLARFELADETLKVPGETRAGEKHAEYYVDEDALEEMIVDLYYEPV